MILYTVLPPEMVMETPTPTTSCRQMESGILEGSESAAGFMVARLISTNPALYLDPKYAPGSVWPPAKS